MLIPARVGQRTQLAAGSASHSRAWVRTRCVPVESFLRVRHARTHGYECGGHAPSAPRRRSVPAGQGGLPRPHDHPSPARVRVAVVVHPRARRRGMGDPPHPVRPCAVIRGHRSGPSHWRRADPRRQQDGVARVLEPRNMSARPTREAHRSGEQLTSCRTTIDPMPAVDPRPRRASS
jgi:hypothetical protein